MRTNSFSPLKIQKILAALCLTVLFSSFVFAASDFETDLKNITNNAGDRIKQIGTDIKSATNTYFENKAKMKELEDQLEPLKNQRATLETQLGIFDEQVKLENAKIQNVEIQVNQKRLEVAKLQEILERAGLETAEQKNMVFEFIREIYKSEQQNLSSESAPEFEKLLLSNMTFSKTLQDMQFLSMIESLSRAVFYRLDEASAKFIEKKEDLEGKTRSLNALKNILEQEKITLLAQKEGRETLLAETKGREEEYQKLLAESKLQAGEALLALANLRDNKVAIDGKLTSFDQTQFLSEQEQKRAALKEMLTNSATGEYSLEKLINDISLMAPLMWPVNPERGLSAYFHDSDYKNFFGVAHNAIDIREPQGTSILAPASAYVQEVKDNGMGYSYIFLAHKNGLSTLYGHVSQILVKQGDIVQMGAVIGKTGGTPGTRGAGVMTTGPHLHFEVHKDGKFVNPLDYLPMELLAQK